MYRPTRKVAGVLASVGLGIGLLGGGVYATFTSGATATDKLATGSFGCQVSSTDPNAVASADGNSVTITNPPILSSVSGNYLTSVSVKNTGTVPQIVHWTVAPGPDNTMALQPAGRMGYASGSNADPMSADLSLAGGASHTYTNGIGFMWAVLTNADLTQTAEVVYSATCSEVPPTVASNVSFIGVTNGTPPTVPSTTATVGAGSMYTWVSQNGANPPFFGTGVFAVASTAAFSSGANTVTVATSGTTPATINCTGTTATSFTGCVTASGTGYAAPGAAVKGVVAPLAMPSGATTGDIALVMTYGATGGNNPQVPLGYSSVASNAGAGNMQTDLAYKVLTASDTSIPFPSTGYGMEIAVYRGVAGVGAHTYNGGNVNNVGGAAYPLNCSALTLTKTDGSSWVACMGGDGYASTNAKAMVFGANTTNRSSGNASSATGLADTNAGVSTWANASWPGDNFPLPGSHGVVVHSIELLSK